jgi:hypothetical protein
MVSNLVVSSLIFGILKNGGIGGELDDDTGCFGARGERERDRVGIKAGTDVGIDKIYPAPFNFEENLVVLRGREGNFVELGSRRS